MKLFRYHIEIECNYSDTEILLKLNNNIEIGEPTTIYGWSKSEKPFRGIIKNNSFKISKTFTGRNSLLPFIFGKVENGLITLDFSLFPFVKLFVYIIGAILNLVILTLLLSLKNYIGILIFMSAQIALVIISQVGFWNNYRDAIKEFKKIINEP